MKTIAIRLDREGDLYPDGSADKRRLPTEATHDLFTAWQETYATNLKTTDPGEVFLALGREMLAWLNQHGWLNRLRRVTTLELRIDDADQPLATAFLECPWELLANEKGHLVLEKSRLQVVRRIGEPEPAPAPSTHRLSTVFMAAAPGGRDNLFYETEEAAILSATEKTGLDLIPEESGNLDQLVACIAHHEPVDVVHLSCHGTNEPEPVLLLEDARGNPEPVGAERLTEALIDKPPRLIFISACQTASPGAVLGSLACELTDSGFPAVLGWSGSVGDSSASEFAAGLYQRLAQKTDLIAAVAGARRALTARNKYWSLARLYLGPEGGAARRAVDQGYRAFLNAKDQEIQVASGAELVGRRRQLQAILAHIQTPDQWAGVLIHGMGGLGKSSLAARVANRLTDHRAVIVFKRYAAADIIWALKHFTGSDRVAEILDAAGPTNLQNGLMKVLEGPCKDKHGEDRPVLLIIDDLERVLESDKNPVKVKTEAGEALRAVIGAFSLADTRSRLLITSRYTFTLPLGDKDLAQSLLAIQLPPMSDHESRKQALAKARTGTGSLPMPAVQRIRAATKGNPRLQNLLFTVGTESLEALDPLIDQMEHYLRSGELPTDDDLRDELENLILEKLLGYLSENEHTLLRTSLLFAVPVPLNLFDLLAREMAPAKPNEAVGARLLGFGLWARYTDLCDRDTTAVACSELVRPLLEPLSESEAKAIAGIVLDELVTAWGGVESPARPRVADTQLVRLAMLEDRLDILAVNGADAVSWLFEQDRTREAAMTGKHVITALEEAEVPVSGELLRQTGKALHRFGETRVAETYLAQAVAIMASEDNREEIDTFLLIDYGDLLIDLGKLEQASACFREAATTLEQEGRSREAAIAIGYSARIETSRGEVEAALALHEEQVKIFEALEDKRSRAVTLGDIARIKASKGEVEGALALHEERLAVYEALEDKRSRAVTLGDIARIKASKGEVEAALALQEERLAVNNSLGDLDGIAIALWDIAILKHSLERYEESLEHLVQSYKISLQLGRLDAICGVGREIGVYLCQAGQVEQAIPILERSLEGYQRLGWMQQAAYVQSIIDELQNQDPTETET